MPEASPRPSPTLDVPRLDTSISFRKEAYAAQKRAIAAMDIYDQVIVWPLTLPRCGPSLSPHGERARVRDNRRCNRPITIAEEKFG